MRSNYFKKLSLQMLIDFIDECYDDKDFGLDFELACEERNNRINPVICSKID